MNEKGVQKITRNGITYYKGQVVFAKWKDNQFWPSFILSFAKDHCKVSFFGQNGSMPQPYEFLSKFTEAKIKEYKLPKNRAFTQTVKYAKEYIASCEIINEDIPPNNNNSHVVPNRKMSHEAVFKMPKTTAEAINMLDNMVLKLMEHIQAPSNYRPKTNLNLDHMQDLINMIPIHSIQWSQPKECRLLQHIILCIKTQNCFQSTEHNDIVSHLSAKYQLIANHILKTLAQDHLTPQRKAQMILRINQFKCCL